MSLLGTGKHLSGCSNSTLLPEQSIQMSPQHTEESNEVAQINTESNHIFPLSSTVEENQTPGFITTAVLSPDSLVGENTNSNHKKSSASSPPCKRNVNGDVITLKKNSLQPEEDVMDTSDEGFSSMRTSSNDSSLKESPVVTATESMSRRESFNAELDNSSKEGQTVPNSELENSTTKNTSVKVEVSLQTEGSQTDQEAVCALTGFVTSTARNGDSTMHGVLPSVLSHSQGTALSSCFPGSDGNWYQIISASVPSVTNQHLSENNSSNKQNPITTAAGSITASSGGNTNCALRYLSSLPLTAMAATTSTFSSHGAPITTPVTTADPVLGFITAGPACGPDNHTTLPALHLPLSLPAGGVPHTPRYIYATNPRTGQLLILSSVGELAGAQALQQQQLHLQQHQVMQQIQQQQMQSQEKTGWKSPLGTSQQQNTLSSVANGLVGKQTAKPGSLINQLLQNKLPCSMALGRATQDENMPSVAAAQELLALASPARTHPIEQGRGLPPLFHSSPDLTGDEPVKENHNMKERRRRARIKDACDLMRQLVPGISEKTDKATVFEFSARYIHFLKNFVGIHHDKDFLIKYSPY